MPSSRRMETSIFLPTEPENSRRKGAGEKGTAPAIRIGSFKVIKDS